MNVYDIDLPKPRIGNKAFLAQQPGAYILERGPALWRAMACTHMGNSAVSVYNGVPNKNGKFLPETTRMIFNADPAILGMWMFDADCEKGLTLVVHTFDYGTKLSPCITIVWQQQTEQKRQIENV